jgi:hypothetical protein
LCLEFEPSHRQLIIRSDPTKVEGTDARSEVYFGHVEFTALRPIYRGLPVGRANDDQAAEIHLKFDVTVDSRVNLYLLEILQPTLLSPRVRRGVKPSATSTCPRFADDMPIVATDSGATCSKGVGPDEDPAQPGVEVADLYGAAAGAECGQVY